MNACRIKTHLITALTVSAALLTFPGCPPLGADGVVLPGGWGFIIVPDVGDERRAGRTLNANGSTSDFFFEGANLVGDITWIQVDDTFTMRQDAGLGLRYVFGAIVTNGTRLSGRYINEDTTEQGSFSATRISDESNAIGPGG